MAKKNIATEVDANAPSENIVVINAIVKSVQVLSAGEDNVRYKVTLDTELDAMKKNYDTEEFELTQVDYIDFVPRVLIAQCISHIENLEVLYTKKKEQALKSGSNSGFGASELHLMLKGAKIEIERTRFEAGDEYITKDDETKTHEYAGYNTNITAIKVSDKMIAKLDAMVDNMLFG